MKRRTYMFLIIALGALLQQILPGIALFGGIKPPILAALALHHALHKGKPDLWMAVFFAALLRDGLDLGSFGPALLAFPALGWFAVRIRNEIFFEELATQMVLGAMMGLFAALVALLVYSATGQRAVPPGLAFARLAGSLLLGMATLPLVSRAVNALESLSPKRKGYGWQ